MKKEQELDRKTKEMIKMNKRKEERDKIIFENMERVI